MSEQTSDACTCPLIPEHLHRNGRGEDHNFEQAELIYRRLPPQDLQADGINLNTFDIDNMSCNRQRFSQSSDDVLHDSACKRDVSNFGILESTVAQIESIAIPHPVDPTITYRPKLRHNSLCCMFPHVEVVIMNNGIPVEKVKPTTVRLRLREHYQNVFVLIKQPTQ